MDSEEARRLVSARIPSANLVNHSLAVGIIMAALARRLGMGPGDVERWEVAGIAHDLDYAETVDDFDRHGIVTAEELTGVLDAPQIHAILAHADKAERIDPMDMALYCADPTTGFIVAAALVRPDKDLAGVQLGSLTKRWKEKAFARGASREQMATCADLGLERDEFLALSLAAMQARASEIGF
jgi:putative nucleotidyltransferase with HDIG domain